MTNQLTVNVDASRDDQTEDDVKAIYAKTGATVRGAVAPLQPEQRGLNGLIQGLDEVSGVGDWAFATNVASTSLGPGFSIRGRILEARKGPWHVTVSTTVAPDPGAAALDGKMAGVARALIAKLVQLRSIRSRRKPDRAISAIADRVPDLRRGGPAGARRRRSVLQAGDRRHDGSRSPRPPTLYCDGDLRRPRRQARDRRIDLYRRRRSTSR